MKAFVFLLLMVMPNGEAKHHSRIVEVCPDKASIDALFNQMQDEGEILDWNAVCFQFQTRGAY